MVNRPQIAFNFFRQKGLPAPAAAGFVGSLMQESGPSLDPTAVGDNGASFGIGQWNRPAGRLPQLESFAAERGTDRSDFETQLEFAWHELESKPFMGLERLQQADTPAEAARVATARFFRPSKPEIENRIAYANQIMEGAGEFEDLPGTTPGRVSRDDTQDISQDESAMRLMRKLSESLGGGQEERVARRPGEGQDFGAGRSQTSFTGGGMMQAEDGTPMPRPRPEPTDEGLEMVRQQGPQRQDPSKFFRWDRERTSRLMQIWQRLQRLQQQRQDGGEGQPAAGGMGIPTPQSAIRAPQLQRGPAQPVTPSQAGQDAFMRFRERHRPSQ